MMIGILVAIGCIGVAVWFFTRRGAGESAMGCSVAMVLLALIVMGGMWANSWWYSRGLTSSTALTGFSALSDTRPDPDQARSSRMMWISGTVENNGDSGTITDVRLELDLRYCDLAAGSEPVNCVDADKTIARNFRVAIPPGQARQLSERILVTEVPEGKAVAVTRYSVERACGTGTNYEFCSKD